MYLSVWCTNSTLLRSPNPRSFPDFNMKFLGVLCVICMMKTLHFKGNQKEHDQDNTGGDGKGTHIFAHCPTFLTTKKKKTASSTTWDYFRQRKIKFQNQRVLKKKKKKSHWGLLFFFLALASMLW